jgi:hypothetical protein
MTPTLSNRPAREDPLGRPVVRSASTRAVRALADRVVRAALLSSLAIRFALPVAAAATGGADDHVAVGDDLDRGAGIVVHHQHTGSAGFGDATIRERRSGGLGWTPEFSAARQPLRLRFDYDYTHVGYDGLQTRNRDLHRLIVALQWRARDGPWYGELAPAIATSSNVFKDLAGRGSREDFDLYGRIGYRRLGESGRGWRIALVRDAAFGAPRLYPTAALLWREPRWSADLGLPTTRVAWQPTAAISLGAVVLPDGGHWHVTSDERGGAEFDYESRTWRAAVTASWAATASVRIDLQAGVAFRRRHVLEDDTGTRIARDAGTAPYWGIAIAMRL